MLVYGYREILVLGSLCGDLGFGFGVVESMSEYINIYLYVCFIFLSKIL